MGRMKAVIQKKKEPCCCLFCGNPVVKKGRRRMSNPMVQIIKDRVLTEDFCFGGGLMKEEEDTWTWTCCPLCEEEVTSLLSLVQEVEGLTRRIKAKIEGLQKKKTSVRRRVVLRTTTPKRRGQEEESLMNQNYRGEGGGSQSLLEEEDVKPDPLLSLLPKPDTKFQSEGWVTLGQEDCLFDPGHYDREGQGGVEEAVEDEEEGLLIPPHDGINSSDLSDMSDSDFILRPDVKKKKKGSPTQKPLSLRVLCPTCGKSISKSTYSKHVARKHLHLNPFPCPKCPNKSFFSKAQLKEHFDVLHSAVMEEKVRQVAQEKEGSKFLCTKCNQTYASSLQLIRHLSRSHALFHDHVCSYCGKGFATRSRLSKHERLAHLKRLKIQEKTLGNDTVCGECGQDFSTLGLLEEHKVTKHRLPSEFPCTLCQVSLRSLNKLGEHAKSLHPNEGTLCLLCGVRFDSCHGRKLHFRQVHKKRDNFPCGKCPKVFNRASKLLRHESIHEKRKNEEVMKKKKRVSQT